MSDKLSKSGVQLKIDANAFKTLFASLDTGKLRDSVNDALRDEAKRMMDEAYSYSYAGAPLSDVLFGIGHRIPDTLDALPMRKNADGVFVLDKHANTYVTEEEAAAYPQNYQGDFVKVKPPKKYR